MCRGSWSSVTVLCRIIRSTHCEEGDSNLMTQHTANKTQENLQAVVNKLDELIREARAQGGTEQEPKAQALFETTAEVAIGLKKAYEDYAKGGERAWQ